MVCNLSQGLHSGIQWFDLKRRKFLGHYYRSQVERIASRCSALLSHLIAPLPNTEVHYDIVMSRNTSRKTPRVSPRQKMSKNKGWSWKDFKGSPVCDTEEVKITPGWAKNEDGEWLVILQVWVARHVLRRRKIIEFLDLIILETCFFLFKLLFWFFLFSRLKSGSKKLKLVFAPSRMSRNPSNVRLTAWEPNVSKDLRLNDLPCWIRKIKIGVPLSDPSFSLPPASAFLKREDQWKRRAWPAPWSQTQRPRKNTKKAVNRSLGVGTLTGSLPRRRLWAPVFQSWFIMEHLQLLW